MTRPSVRIAERVSRVLITFGGLGTIVAVTTIFGFLLWVVAPLFRGAEVGNATLQSGHPRTAEPVAVGSDEYGVLVWSVYADGTLEVLARESTAPLLERPLVEGAAPTAFAIAPDGAASALGFADGSVRLLRIGFLSRLLEPNELTPALEGMAVGGRALHGDGVVERLAGGEVRLQRPSVTLGEPLPLCKGPIVRLDRADLSSGYALATVEADGTATLHQITERPNLLDSSKPPRIKRVSCVLPGGSAPAAPLPSAVRVPAAGDNVYLVWEDGRCQRFDTRDLDAPRLAEALDLLPEPDARVTAVGWMLGRTTLLVGDSTGRTRGWFRTKPYGTTTLDGSVLENAQRLEGPRAAVLSLAPGQRHRVLAVGYADGSARVFHVTSEQQLTEVRQPHGPLAAVALGPKEDVLLARVGPTLSRWTFDARHPEAGLASVFGKVWYEGLEHPAHVWQSTGGTDDFEPKLGLVPLVFGTLKATVYSMLFGAPLALLAAIFTSEFLGARLRTSIKSVIEIMASLPSVVLGFLAALVVAPFVQDVVPTVLTWFLVAPTLLLLAAHLWQLLPNHVSIRLAGLPRLACVVAVFPLSVLAASALAPTLERALFRGDLGAWLNHEVSHAELARAALPAPAQPVGADADDRTLLAGLLTGRLDPQVPAARRAEVLAEAGEQVAGRLPRDPGAADAAAGSPLLTSEEAQRVRAAHLTGAAGGWTYLLVPLAVGLVLLAFGRWVNPWLRRASKEWSRRRCALAALLRLSAALLLACATAWGLGQLMSTAGLDPRGSFDYATRGEGAVMGSPVQRNALVVGFLMGFAIIPIIYTLAEDALSSVPQHLRLGSLGAGATPWQTATRIIIPTAMSGLFSAVMIGLGRAVGETMIVLMAAGNTSVLEWNMFNGFRTLSANIATEMPEAVVGGTHYRVLFLAALTLFAITFVLNTIAESVRQRFRRRAFQL